VRLLIIGLIASQAIAAAAIASERPSTSEASAVADVLKNVGKHANPDLQATMPLDRVATAVDGAESSHGTDLNMWRQDASGPQGPMQVSKAAALDVGGGDRFDLAQNRAIGRAYLAQLYGHYGIGRMRLPLTTGASAEWTRGSEQVGPRTSSCPAWRSTCAAFFATVACARAPRRRGSGWYPENRNRRALYRQH